MRRDHIEPLGDRKSRRIGGNDEGGNTPRARRFTAAGKDDIEIGDATVRDPGLFPVQNVAVAVAPRGQGNIGHVRAGLPLGERKRGDSFTAARARQPFALLRIAEQTDRPGAQTLHRKGKVGECVVPRQRLANKAERSHIKQHRAAGIGRGMSEPAVAAELLHQVAAGGVEITVPVGAAMRR